MRRALLLGVGLLVGLACADRNRAERRDESNAAGSAAKGLGGAGNNAAGGGNETVGNAANASGQGGVAGSPMSSKKPTGGSPAAAGVAGNTAVTAGRNGNGSSGTAGLDGGFGGGSPATGGSLATGGASTAGTGTSGSATGGTDNAAGAGDASTLEGFFRDYCVAIGPCCIGAQLTPNVDDCVGALASELDGRTYDATAGGECAAWLDTATQHGTMCAPLGTWPQSCSHALRSAGTKQPGEDCANDNDCAPSDEGDVKCAYGYTMNMSEFRCQVEVPGTSGSTPCGGTIDGAHTFYTMFMNVDVPSKAYLCSYADGVYCNQGAECSAVSSVGGACTDQEGCTKDAWCNLPMQLCIARTLDGGDCATNNFECVSDEYCDDGTGTCKALLGNGAACSTSQQCRSNQCFNSACLGDQAADPTLSYLCDF